MQSKLQELTEKIYQEGVEKGNAEANQIIENAKSEAGNIVDQAKKEADKIIAEAKKKAEETKNNTESEIRLSGKQAVNALKQKVVDLVNGSITETAVKESFDKDFISQIVKTTLENWSKSGQTMDLQLLLPKKDEQALQKYFEKEARSFLDKGVSFKFDSSIDSGFQLSPSDGSYKISFTDEDFINFFKQYLRPKLVEILFSGE